MVQVVAATFKDGVFKPDQRPALSESTRVRLVVETINGDESEEGGAVTNPGRRSSAFGIRPASTPVAIA